MLPVYGETRGSFRGQFVWPTFIAIALGCGCLAGGGVFANGARLLTRLTVESVVAVSATATGRNNMRAFRDSYSIDELDDVAADIIEDLAGD